MTCAPPRPGKRFWEAPAGRAITSSSRWAPGIGAAVVIGGKPYSGTHATAGEMGHMTIDPDGPECGCGAHGHVEAYASAGGLRRRYAEATGGDVIPTELLVARAVAGEQPARRIWEQAIDALAVALADAIVLLDPDRVVIGGGLAAAGELLVRAARASASAERLPFGRAPAIAPAELGAEAGVRGMAVLTWRGIARSASSIPEEVR